MFNDIDKKLRFTWFVNLIIGVAFSWFTKKYAVVVLQYDQSGRGIPEKVLDPKIWSGILNTLAGICIAVSILSLWICLALTFNKCGPFKWLKGAGKTLRIIGWISLIGGGAAGFSFCFWSFFRVYSENAVVNAISYTFISIIPVAALIFCFSCFWYGLGNAADGGDATYVKDSKLFDMETLHGEADTRKRCPDCGTRTDRHSCPNCGARID